MKSTITKTICEGNWGVDERGGGGGGVVASKTRQTLLTPYAISR